MYPSDGKSGSVNVLAGGLIRVKKILVDLSRVPLKKYVERLWAGRTRFFPTANPPPTPPPGKYVIFPSSEKRQAGSRLSSIFFSYKHVSENVKVW